MIRRREFISLFGGAAAWPVAAEAQKAKRRIGVLMPYPASDVDGLARVAAFRQELRRLGLADDSVHFDEHWAGSDEADSIRIHASELAASKPDVILVSAPRALKPMQQATSTIPIVFTGVSDPVGAGFVKSLARPGGNTTGFALIEFTVIGKLLEALKQIAPATTCVAMMSNPVNPSTGLYLRCFGDASATFAIQRLIFPVRNADEIEHAIETIAAQPNSGILVPPDVTINVHRELVTSLAARYRLPAIYSNRPLVVSGGLMYYGPDIIDQFRRAASYVDRILRGEKPADLPIQQPTKFEFVINLRAATALGLDVPGTLLARADEVIE